MVRHCIFFPRTDEFITSSRVSMFCVPHFFKNKFVILFLTNHKRTLVYLNPCNSYTVLYFSCCIFKQDGTQLCSTPSNTYQILKIFEDLVLSCYSLFTEGRLLHFRVDIWKIL